MPRLKNALFSAAPAVALALFLAGCSDDFGTPCDFPSSPDIADYCSTEIDADGNESTATCVDPLNPGCESRLCIIFQGSDAFCSDRCSSDGGCPGGSTCLIPVGSETGACVPNRLIE